MMASASAAALTTLAVTVRGPAAAPAAGPFASRTREIGYANVSRSTHSSTS